MDSNGSKSQEIKQEPGSMIGRVLDRYKILGKLGEGGMGEVYEVEHVRIHKRFALKLLRQEIVTNEEAVKRFEQEAKSAASIGHKNIVDITDSGEMDDGRVFLVMEKLKGTPLNELIDSPQEDQRLLNILIQTCHGLAAAHKKGIVHRDMKPENIFVVQNQGLDVPKILDFGIAKVSGADGNNNLTRTGAIFGTPFYMAPEQALGQQVDHRADVYAIGVIMFEMFCGQVPFDGESFMGILTQHITTEPPNPIEVATSNQKIIPKGLDIVIKKAMSKEADDRYQSMDALVNSLVMIYRSVEGAGMSSYVNSDTVAVTPGSESHNALSSSYLSSSASRSPSEDALASRSRELTDSAFLKEAADSYKPANRLRWLTLLLPVVFVVGGAVYFLGKGTGPKEFEAKNVIVRDGDKPLVVEKKQATTDLEQETLPASDVDLRPELLNEEKRAAEKVAIVKNESNLKTEKVKTEEALEQKPTRAALVPVVISSFPRNADIYIGGIKSEYSTPAKFDIDPNSPFSVSVRKKGYVSETIELNGDVPEPFLKLQKKKKPGKVSPKTLTSDMPRKRTDGPKKGEKKAPVKPKETAKSCKKNPNTPFCRKRPKTA